MGGKRDNMLNKKGQALIEFIMILPVFLMLVIGMIDFGKIIYEKYTLQNKLDLVVNLYTTNKIDNMNSYINDNQLKLKIEKNSNYITLTITKEVNIATPVLNKILNNPYIVEESIVVLNDEVE